MESWRRVHVLSLCRLGGVFLAGWLLLATSPFASAMETVHQNPADFLEAYLPGCEKRALWLDQAAKAEVEHLLERPFPGVRVRYCQAAGKTAWILDEIGKTEPITTGVVVDHGRVERVRVLIFRESRGGEVHRDAFTRQYLQAELRKDGSLDRGIDGITGATLSVWAVSRQVRLALLLDGLSRGEAGDL
jgi:hypothetical protein